jgi:ribose transport system permease protein
MATLTRTTQERSSRTRRWLTYLSFRRISAVYLLVVMVAVFAVWVPDTFLTTTTLRAILSEQAITALLAVGLVIPLAAGVFDLSIALILGSATVTIEWLMVNQGVSAAPAILLILCLGVAIGALNGLMVAGAKIDSFIATLGMSSALTAYVIWVTGYEQIVGSTTGFFPQLATTPILGVTSSFYIMVGVAAIVWYVLSHRPAGRMVYATGGGIEAARLAGIRVRLVIFLALVAAGLVAAIAGILLASQVGVGDSTEGPPYLIPAFAAAFLGSTQIHTGRFNVWGTVLSVYVLAVGVQGLQLAGAPSFISDLFNGVALVLAVWLSRVERRRKSDNPAPNEPQADVGVGDLAPYVEPSEVAQTGQEIA